MFEELSPPYGTIVVDPPWHYDAPMPAKRKGGQSVRLAYSTMSLDEICDLPVFELTGNGGHLYLWTTNRHLESAFQVARSWGFEPSTTLVWCKPPNGLGATGRYTVTTEFVLFASRTERSERREVARAGELLREAREAAGLTRESVRRFVRGGRTTGLVGQWEADACLPTERDWAKLQEILPALRGVARPVVPPPPPRGSPNMARVDSTWFQWSRGAPSEKPAAFLDMVEQMSPGPYVELFARQPRLGWDSWGYGYEAAS